MNVYFEISQDHHTIFETRQKGIKKVDPNFSVRLGMKWLQYKHTNHKKLVFCRIAFASYKKCIIQRSKNRSP